MKNVIDLNDVIYLPAPKDISHLLVDIPEGDWVVLTNDQERVLSFGSDLSEAIQKAHAAGENVPFVTRVPESDTSLLFL